MKIPEYRKYDGLGLAELIQTKQVSPAELMATAVAAIEQDNPRLNAVNVKDFTRAAAQITAADPQSPFYGVPFLIKDIIANVAGLPTSSGSRYLSEHVWNHDSELVKRYRRAGLIILGKTNLPEFGLAPSSENLAFGDTCNPWDVTRSAGGSSAGAAAAVASGMMPMAHASDGGGSIRIPASCCGLFGFKPSRGRTPTGPDYGRLWQGLAIEHALTRTVRDSAALLDCTHGPDLGAPHHAPVPAQPFLTALQTPPRALKIGFLSKPFFPAQVATPCIEAVESAAKLCASLGHQVEHVDLDIAHEAVMHAAVVMMSAELAAVLDLIQHLSKRRIRQRDLELPTAIFYRLGCKQRAPEFLQAILTFELLARRIALFFVRYDVLITPTVAQLPPKLGELQPSAWETVFLHGLKWLPNKAILRAVSTITARRLFAYTPYTMLFNITGQPAMSLPLSFSQGLPVGVQFVGPYGQDGLMLQLARQIEVAQPWFQQTPY